MIETLTSFNIEETFAEDGPIAKALPSFESRPQQTQMALAIQKALALPKHLVAEAGTGVGKSFAYLVPAIELAHRKKIKVLVSTFTITLQEQLINKDLPFLVEALALNFTAVLAKGRANYICLRRLEFAIRAQQGLFDEFASRLTALKNWARQTADGSLSDLGAAPRAELWDAVKSEHGNCRSRKCPHFQKCFYWRARRQLECADIIVANHALMFSDLVLKQQGAAVLPDYKYVIIDEAHNIEHVAEDHFGINITNRQIQFLLRRLYNPKTHRGLLTYITAAKPIDTVIEINKSTSQFFKKIRSWYAETVSKTNGRCEKNFVEDTMSSLLIKLKSQLTKLINSTKDQDQQFEIARFADRCQALAEQIKCFLNQQKPQYIYWVELNNTKRPVVRLRSAPVNVGPDIKKALFDINESVVLTSATLTAGPIEQSGSFEFFAERVGLEDYETVKVGSPFDYEKQVTIYIEKDLPNPNEPAFIEQAASAIKKYVKKTHGSAFVLFTSYAMLTEIAEKLDDWLTRNNFRFLSQDSPVDRTVLLKTFKTTDNSVLFGTDSFWQGVDVPGQALCNVIIVKLPFAVPTQPLIAGRIDKIRQDGQNPFYQYQLPSAVIKFKQGFGRLIRTKTDTGIVAILDSRIVNKPYGRQFLSAVPKCKTIVV